VHEAIGGVVVAQTEDAPELPIPVDDDLSDGDILRFGDAAVSVIHLRGHTPGSVAILYDAEGRLADSPHLFTGDSLFPGGPGKTSSPETFNSLMNDLEERVFGRLPDGTWVYPGHGADTTLGTERPHLSEWRARGW
jgi:glyoxylase-like metal-dependent hydrolase (beta-lactamase superfamily II)